MRVELTGRHVDITPPLRRLVDARLAKLERLLNDTAVSSQVVLTREKYRLCAEITVHARGEKFMHCVASARTWEASLAQAIEKLAQQAQTVKGKWQGRKRRAPRPVPEGAELEQPAAGPVPERLRMPRAFGTTRQRIRPMSVAEAVRDVQKSVEGLIVFRDPERSAISVMYRRQNGDLTLVETEE